LAAVNIALVYVHYYGWMIVGLELLYLLWLRRPVRNFALSVMWVAAAFAPWAIAAGRTLHSRGLEGNLGWVAKPGLTEFLWFHVDLAGCADMGRIATAGSGLVFALVLWSQPVRSWPMFLWLAPAPIAFLVSQALPQSIWGHRHLAFAMWPLLLLLADAIWHLPSRFKMLALAIAGVWSLAAVASHAHDNRKLPWDRLTIALARAEGGTSSPVVLYSPDAHLHYPIGFFLDAMKKRRWEPFGPRADEAASLQTRLEVRKIADMAEAQGPHFWIGYTDSGWTNPQTPREILERRGCRAGEAIVERDRFHAAILLPVDCPP
jgi:hypothetical protein